MFTAKFPAVGVTAIDGERLLGRMGEPRLEAWRGRLAGNEIADYADVRKLHNPNSD
jgi:hypothetical protein